MSGTAIRDYMALCEERCDGEGTWDEEVAEAWAALPLIARLRCILSPALRDALHEVLQSAAQLRRGGGR